MLATTRPLAGQRLRSSSERASPSRCSVVGCEPNQNWLQAGGSSSLRDLVASCICIRSNAVKSPVASSEDRWPTAADLGAPVIMPGGEVGILIAWWNAEDGSEWRWQVELYNHA